MPALTQLEKNSKIIIHALLHTPIREGGRVGGQRAGLKLQRGVRQQSLSPIDMHASSNIRLERARSRSDKHITPVDSRTSRMSPSDATGSTCHLKSRGRIDKTREGHLEADHSKYPLVIQ